jgi:hypothetical protein|tara:strand:- start:24 stop:263 length:240 start_codon:yes stop_codon:yes gene_type:complete
MDNEKLLTSKEYNTIAVKLLTDFTYDMYKKEIDLILDKLFIMTIKDLDTVLIEDIKKEKQIREEHINKPITTKPIITNS